MEKLINIEIGTVLFAYCVPCDLVLYTANKVDPTTEGVAWTTANDHSIAFEPVHKCIVYTDEGGENGKGNPE